jgi:hypothetical protein
MAVALLALTLALTGSAVAAGELSEPAGPTKANVVTNPMLATGAVDGRVLADESVASRHLANPVYSAKVNYPKLAMGYSGLTGVGVKTVRFGNTMGLFHVDFEQTVADCAVTATSEHPGMTAKAHSYAKTVDVQLTVPKTTVLPSGAVGMVAGGAPTWGSFSVIAHCP